MMIFPDGDFATRFEQNLALGMRDYVRAFRELFPDLPAEELSIGGGTAVCMGSDYLNVAVGMAMGESVTSDEIDSLEAFFSKHQAPPRVEICPFTDDSLLTELNTRGYHLVDFTTAYVHDLNDIPDNESEILVRPVEQTEKDVWVRTVTDTAPDDVTTDTRLAQSTARKPDTIHFLATIDDVPAGASTLSIYDEIAVSYFTSTRKTFRNRGVQTAMIRARLAYAKAHGCTMVFADTVPGGVSMRNLLRAGFQVAYTRCGMQKQG